MKQLVEEFVQQLRQATALGEKNNIRFAGLQFNNVVIAGMGGSGISASMVQAYVTNKLDVPVVVNKSYTIPAFVNSNTLFIASSLSGNTEETIAGVRTAMECGATVCFITSDGEALRLAQHYKLPHLAIPDSMHIPRACLGFSFVYILYVLHYAGLLGEEFKTELQQSINLLEEQTGSIKVQASALAASFKSKLPVLYASDIFKPVAERFQQQLNTNSKQLCHVNVFPEMNHNEIMGWQYPEQLFEHLAVLLIKSDYDHPRVHLRMDLCKKIFSEKVQDVLEIKAMGATFLEQVFYLVNIFDWVSVYLAELNNVDPKASEGIDYLKDQLSKV
ncbi:bifunctional phosphoglucose/phosphomannose isomerase [Pontibacter sp. MBLB2868]|uniref:bifunctional phosphoglucose/phosphomannose isomerase n=1 Tax=Pontibacter sp. MBLB2868 TaxID=3451555 RepID=UPI003F754E91